MSPFIRQNRTIIRISGKDAKKLLNDVLSVEFEASPNSPKWWALFSAGGKIQAEGLSIFFGNSFWLDIHRNVADNFLKKMRLYRFRADVEFENLQEDYIVAWSKEKIEQSICFLDPRNKNLGLHSFIEKQQATNLDENCNGYATERIGLGISELCEDFEPDSLFAHDIGMDLLGGVDFSKGCYIGQEVVSRMQHKANIKRRPVIVSNISALSFSEIFVNEKKIGHLGQVINDKSVAIIRLDRISKQSKIFVDGKQVQITAPSWANYQLT